MKKILFAFGIILMSCGIHAQEGYRIYKQTYDGKEKYSIANENGNIIVSAKYDWIDNQYQEGFVAAYIKELKTVDNSSLGALAPAKTGYYWSYRYGFIDARGKELTPFKYRLVRKFKHGVAMVQSGDKWGYLNSQGIEITPFKYDEIKEGFDASDKLVRVYQVYVNAQKKYGLLATSGKELTAPLYDEIEYFRDGLALMTKNGMKGVLNLDGKEVAAARYSALGTYGFREGVCRVSWNNKWGFIDKTGKEIVPLLYDRVSDFDNDGTAMVTLDKKTGRIDKAGKVIVPLRYVRVDPISDGLYSVRTEAGYGWVDQAGNEVIPPSYGYGSSFVGGLAYVRIDKKFGAIDKRNTLKIPLEYEDIGRLSEKLPLLYFKQGGKYGFFSESQTEITPAKYTSIYNLAQGRSFVRINNKWGLVNEKGREIAEVKYDTLIATDVSPGVLAVLNQKIGFLSNSGVVIIPLKYDYLQDFSEGLYSVMINEKFGFVNEQGKEVIPLIYDEVGNFVNGKAQVRSGSQIFYIDKAGKKIE
jgi:hypothetical protein